MSKVGDFRRRLGAELEQRLGGAYRYFVGRVKLVRRRPDGDDIVHLDVNAKYSPHVELYLRFGRRYDAATAAEKAIGRRAAHYHVTHYTVNERCFRALGWNAACTWSIDLDDVDWAFVDEVEAMIREFGDRWFAHFREVRVARDESDHFESDWCLSGFPHLTLAMDAALGDVEHMRQCIASQQMHSESVMEDLLQRYRRYVEEGPQGSGAAS